MFRQMSHFLLMVLLQVVRLDAIVVEHERKSNPLRILQTRFLANWRSNVLDENNEF